MTSRHVLGFQKPSSSMTRSACFSPGKALRVLEIVQGDGKPGLAMYGLHVSRPSRSCVSHALHSGLTCRRLKPQQARWSLGLAEISCSPAGLPGGSRGESAGRTATSVRRSPLAWTDGSRRVDVSASAEPEDYE